MKYWPNVGSLLINMSPDYWSTYRPTQSANLLVDTSANSQLAIAQPIGQHVNQESDSRCQPRDRPGVGRYVDRYGNRESANTLIEYQPIALTETQSRGAQITQDPIRT